MTTLRRRNDPRPLDRDVARGDGRDVILQAFHWNLVKTQGTGTVDRAEQSWYARLRSMVPAIANVGFTIVYLPPPWRDDSQWEHGGRHGGGEGYFWHDFSLDCRYGTKAELTALVEALHRHGIRAIVDLVPNHRDATRMERDRWPYPGPCWARGGHDTGAAFEKGAFDLALDHPTVRGRFREAMDELLGDCGLDGWRWDFVWGYDVAEVVSLIRDTAKVEYFSMGEYWQGDPGRRDDPLIERYGRDERARLVGWGLDTGGCVLDVLTKGRIQSADPRELVGGLASSRRREDRRLAVTYVDNHDTGASPWCPANGWGAKHWECPPGFKSSAYAFILCMPGTPCVYWPDCFDWGHQSAIAALIAARRGAGVVADSDWIDLTDRQDGFAALVADAGGEARLAIAIGSTWGGPAEAPWRCVASRHGEWTVWTRPPRSATAR